MLTTVSEPKYRVWSKRVNASYDADRAPGLSVYVYSFDDKAQKISVFKICLLLSKSMFVVHVFA